MKNKIERFNMCKDQLAQIDCVREDCIFNKYSGNCRNISPAIRLNDDKTYVCLSFKNKGTEEA